MRKKAALTLLRIYRKHPDVIPAAEWALRIVALMDDMDLVRAKPLCGGGNEADWTTGRRDLRYQFSDGLGTGPPRSLCSMLPKSCR